MLHKYQLTLSNMELLKSNHGVVKYQRLTNYPSIFDLESKYLFIGVYVPSLENMTHNKSYIIKHLASIIDCGIKQTFNLVKEATYMNPIKIPFDQIVPIDNLLNGSIHFIAQSEDDEIYDREENEENIKLEKIYEKTREAEAWVETLPEKEQEYVRLLKQSMLPCG